MDLTFQQIIDNGLIEKKQLKDCEASLKNSGTKSNSAYLSALFQAEYEKLTGHSYSPIGTYLNFGTEKPKSAEQIKINEELTLYLSKLRFCG